MTRVTLGKSRVRESRMPGSVRAKAEWLSYSTTTHPIVQGAFTATKIVSCARPYQRRRNHLHSILSFRAGPPGTTRRMRSRGGKSHVICPAVD